MKLRYLGVPGKALLRGGPLDGGEVEDVYSDTQLVRVPYGERYEDYQRDEDRNVFLWVGNVDEPPDGWEDGESNG